MKKKAPDALHVPIKQDPERVANSILNEMGKTKLPAREGAPKGLQDIPKQFHKPAKPPGRE